MVGFMPWLVVLVVLVVPAAVIHRRKPLRNPHP